MAKSKKTTEATPATEETAKPPAVLNPAFAAATVDGYKVRKHVTVPVLSWPDNATIIFMAVDAIRVGKELKAVRAGELKMAPAELMTVASPQGELAQLVVGKVLASELQESYPKDGYVNKWFRATKFPPNTGKGKRYATYSVQEIDNPNH